MIFLNNDQLQIMGFIPNSIPEVNLNIRVKKVQVTVSNGFTMFTQNLVLRLNSHQNFSQSHNIMYRSCLNWCPSTKTFQAENIHIPFKNSVIRCHRYSVSQSRIFFLRRAGIDIGSPGMLSGLSFHMEIAPSV